MHTPGAMPYLTRSSPPRRPSDARVIALAEDELRIPVILVTAFSDLWTRAEAIRYGARLLDKPLELRVLRKLVFDALPGRHN